MKNETAKAILDYAEVHGKFSIAELSAHLQKECGLNTPSLQWYLFKLVEENKLARTGRGIYDRMTKQPFVWKPAEEVRAIYHLLKKKFPFARFCVYQGEILAPLQHHLCSNRTIYLETDRDSAETVFHFLREQNCNAYLRPDRGMIYRYIDLGSRNLFVKNLVSESPLRETEGVPMPTLEKLLVDILRDPDFYFLQGIESEYIIDNAFDLYAINLNRLFRYAARRKVKAELSQILDHLNVG